MSARPTVRDVAARMRSEGVSLPEDERLSAAMARRLRNDDSPWFVRALVGFGAWIASLFFFGFLMAAGLSDAHTAGIVVGAAIFAGAVTLKRTTQHLFLAQLTFAASVSAQILIVASVSALSEDSSRAEVVALALGALSLFAYPDAAHRFLSASVSAIAFAALLHRSSISSSLELAAACLLSGVLSLSWFESELAASPAGEVYESTLYALVVVTIGCLVAVAGAQVDNHNPVAVRGYVSGLTLLALVVGAVRLALEKKLPLSSLAFLATSTAMGGMSVMMWRVPGVSAALLLIALGFRRRRQPIIALAAASLLGFGGFYYFELSISLLSKSGLLLASGVALLGLRALLEKFPFRRVAS